MGKLVLTRKEGERVRVRVHGLDMFLIVGEISNGREGPKVRLCFDGPRDFDLLRAELIPDGTSEEGSDESQ